VYDVVVIGGGIVGVGIARDAALRGLKVALFREGRLRVGHVVEVEQDDHGGCANLSTARSASCSSRGVGARVQTRVAPHLCAAAVLDPIYKGVKPGSRS